MAWWVPINFFSPSCSWWFPSHQFLGDLLSHWTTCITIWSTLIIPACCYSRIQAMADRQTRQASENLKVGAIPLSQTNNRGTQKYNEAKTPSAMRDQQITGQCYSEISWSYSSFHDEKNFNQFCFWTSWWQPKYQKLSEQFSTRLPYWSSHYENIVLTRYRP